MTLSVNLYQVFVEGNRLYKGGGKHNSGDRSRVCNRREVNLWKVHHLLSVYTSEFQFHFHSIVTIQHYSYHKLPDYLHNYTHNTQGCYHIVFPSKQSIESTFKFQIVHDLNLGHHSLEPQNPIIRTALHFNYVSWFVCFFFNVYILYELFQFPFIFCQIEIKY